MKTHHNIEEVKTPDGVKYSCIAHLGNITWLLNFFIVFFFVSYDFLCSASFCYVLQYFGSFPPGTDGLDPARTTRDGRTDKKSLQKTTFYYMFLRFTFFYCILQTN